MKGLHIKRDKTAHTVEDADLSIMQNCVEGWVEPIDLQGFTLWVNEEYTYKFNSAEDVNWLASDIAADNGRPEFLLRPILGDVFITGITDSRGRTLSLSKSAEARIKRVADEAGVTW